MRELLELVAERGSEVAAEVLGITERSVARAKAAGRLSKRLRTRVRLGRDGEVFDAAREARIERYAALVASRGGWNGGGFVFGPRTGAKPVSWLVDGKLPGPPAERPGRLPSPLRSVDDLAGDLARLARALA
ncbi:MAG: hypothetical protein M9894_17120 [Planctomycetes bacterium]|nr:hypothetical protein [Planctomycetota bacterium]